MQIDCLGASREVGRSAFLLHTDHRILLDYGIKIYDLSGKAQYPLDDYEKFSPHFALITHAHLDHSGFVPHLYTTKKIPWYATNPTYDFVDVLWQDSMKIMGEDLPYKRVHFKKAMRNWSPASYNRTMHIGGNSITWRDAGHIAGAGILEIEYKNKKLVYTGDFKMEETRMHRGARPIKDVDYLIIESTYSDRDHPDRRQSEKEFMDILYDTIESGGTLLLPAFALGRSQELISIIRSYDKEVPIYLDGMSKEITRLYLRNSKFIKNPKEFKKQVKSVYFVESINDKKKATSEPGVIITTAGMMNGGPVLNYLFHLNPNSKILFTGYCIEGTNGWKLQTKGYITKDDADLTVDLEVYYIDFSAHAGRSDLLRFIKEANPEKIILVHGDRPLEFAKELREDFGFDAVAPEIGERIILED